MTVFAGYADNFACLLSRAVLTVATVVIPVSLWFVVSSPSVVLTCLSEIVPLVDVGATATVPDFVGMVSCRFDRPSSTYFCDVVMLRGSGSVAYAVQTIIVQNKAIIFLI